MEMKHHPSRYAPAVGRAYANVRYKSKSNAVVSPGGGSSNPFSRVTGSFLNNSYGNKDNLAISKASASNDAEQYKPKELISTLDIAHYFFPLFYAGEKGALGIWDKTVGQGHIKRRVEEQTVKKFHVLELINGQTNTGTFISAPTKEYKALHLNLPHLILIIKNFKRNFSFEVLCLDNRGVRRRLSFATWYTPGNLKRYSFLCQIPLRLDSGWNEIHTDLRELIHSIYKTRYVETLRVQIHANCRIRQVFFCGDEVINQHEMVPSMRLFNNIELLNPEFGPVSHPNFYEPGPERQLHVLHNNFYGMNRKSTHVGYTPQPAHDPLGHFPIGPTRLERDLKMIHNSRYDHLTRKLGKGQGTLPGGLQSTVSSDSLSSGGSKQESLKNGANKYSKIVVQGVAGPSGPVGADGSSLKNTSPNGVNNNNSNTSSSDNNNDERTKNLKSEVLKGLSIPSEMHKSMTLVEIMQRNERLRRREELLEAIAQHQAQQAELRESQKRKIQQALANKSEDIAPASSSPPLIYKPPTIATPPTETRRSPFYFEPKNPLPEPE